MKKVAKKSVKKYGVGGTNNTDPKRTNMPVPTKDPSGTPKPDKKFTFGNSDITAEDYNRLKASQRAAQQRYQVSQMGKPKQKKGGSVKRKK